MLGQQYIRREWMRLLMPTMVVIGLAVTPLDAIAKSKCTSSFEKFESFMKKAGPHIAKGACWLASKIAEDKDLAAECNKTLKKALKELKKAKKKWNGKMGKFPGLKIGPRGLPVNKWQRGKLVIERKFIGLPVATKNAFITLKRKGGKATKDTVVWICFVNSKGDDVQKLKVTIPGAKRKWRKGKKKEWRRDLKFKNVGMLTPMVWFKAKKPFKPFRTMHYQVRIKEYGGAPSVRTKK
jgi:hypothetical protein